MNSLENLPVTTTVSRTMDGHDDFSAGGLMFLADFLRKRLVFLIVIAAVSGLAALEVAHRFTTHKVKTASSLVMRDLPNPTDSNVYRPTPIATYVGLVKSPAVLTRVSEECGLGLSHLSLNRLIEAQVGGRSSIIDVEFNWGDAEQANQILATLMQAFIENVEAKRCDTISAHIRHTERVLVASRESVDTARRRYVEALAAEPAAGETDRELTSLVSRLQSIRGTLDATKIAAVGIQSQIERLEKRRDRVREDRTRLLEEEVTRVTQQIQSLADGYPAGSKGQRRHRDAIDQLNAFALEDVGDSSIDVINQLNLAESQLRTRYVAATVGAPTVEPPTTPVVSAAVSQVRALDTEMSEVTARINELDVEGAAKRDEIAILESMVAEREALVAEYGPAEAARQDSGAASDTEAELVRREAAHEQVQRQLHALRQLRDCDVTEFAVAVEPHVVKETSNKKPLFGGVFMLIGTVLTLPFLRRDYRAAHPNQIESLNRQLGLLSLPSGALVASSGKKMQEQDALRLLALRVRQALSPSGSVLLVSALDDSPQPRSLVCNLAKCFAGREENVLIMEACKRDPADKRTWNALLGASDEQDATDNPSLGIADFLSRQDVSFQDVVASTNIDGVSCIPYGSQPFPIEGLATKRMGELLDQCRENYSLVLAVGPSADELTDLQMAVARADGVVFSVRPGRKLNSDQVDVLRDLIDLRAPVLGVLG